MISIAAKTCLGCGLCTRICPRKVPVLEQDGKEKRAVVSDERDHICICCGQCAALCRSGSITVEGLDPDGFLPVSPHEISSEQMMSLLRQRRSVRRYKAREVTREVLEQLAEAAASAPTLSGAGAIGIIFVTGEEKLSALTGTGYAMFTKVAKLLDNPIGRYMVKRRAGAETVAMLRSFVMPAMVWYRRWHEEGVGDEMRRDAPVVMLFHCAPDEPEGEITCQLAAYQVVLLAETLGLGTCINGMLEAVCQKSDEAQEIIGLPEGQVVHAGLTLGYPKYRFTKTVPRKLTGVRYVS